MKAVPALLLALLAAPALAAEPARTAEQIADCSAANLPDDTARQAVEMRAADRGGGERELHAELFWKRLDEQRGRAMVRISSPPDLSGAAYLVTRKDDRDAMFAYVPSLDRVRRLTGSSSRGSLWGTDFSYEDFRWLEGLARDGKLTRLADATVEERPVWVVSSEPPAEAESAYVEVRSYVDQETCVALVTEFYERSGEPRKRLTAPFTAVKQQNGKWMARDMLMRDLRDETDTRLKVITVEYDGELGNRYYNPRTFYRGN